MPDFIRNFAVMQHFLLTKCFRYATLYIGRP
jgi:hypothetical protein